MLLGSLPAAAWADAATHTLSLQAISRPATANDGESCLLIGQLHAVGSTSADIDVVLVAGGDNAAEQGDLTLSFTHLSSGQTAKAQEDVGGGGCGSLVIRKARVHCPNDGRIDPTFSCRSFTWVQFPHLDAPRIAAIKVGEQWESGIGSEAQPATAGAPVDLRGSNMCGASEKVVSAVTRSDVGGEVVPGELLGAALQDLSAHGCPSAAHRSVGVVDFSPSSGTPRMWIVNLDTGTGIDRPIHVAHGKGSDPSNSGRATIFGDGNASLMSSLGGFRVGAAATTRNHGPVLLLRGLDASNRHALERAILIHTTTRDAADYVSEGWLRKYGKLGRSHGCFVVMATEFPRVSAALRNGGFLYAGRSGS
jgi:hypothetical protein